MLTLDAVEVGVPREFHDDLRLADQVVAEVQGPDGGLCVLTYVVDQPSEVETVLATAVRHGAQVLKPPKKSLFAGFAASCRAPGGSVWKLTAPTRKDTGPAAESPSPTELVAILGVADPPASKAFYEALGMKVDRDYGAKFIDFQLTPGLPRLGLMNRAALAKDAGAGASPAVLTCTVDSRSAVEAILTTANSAGGRSADGEFTDPDGYLWKVRVAP
ncbi:glyoxalase [Amycolatopsis sp. 195334CR]|uniref:glyoxalase n=1 Tax=Amycolatopsis sp. 195334CR TaxID=2814588 RepID=UPI001A8D2308|nr:glyoxalase [Amycolatopsis sp. 195334CR]MBN6034707.1 glyoxalase [Amycolatopsis sp. 195334CR]